jgi:two-component system, sensor histidine kinase
MPMMDAVLKKQPATEKTIALAQPVRLELLRVAQKNGLATIAVQLLAAGALTVSSPVTARTVYMGWLAMVCAVSLFRIFIDRRLSAALRMTDGPFPEKLARTHSAGLLLGASLWAGLACWRFPIDGQETLYLIAMVMSALAGGAIGILAPLRLTGRAYVTIMLVPACITLMVMGEGGVLMGGVGLVFWLVMITGHRNNNNVLLRSILLSQENSLLVSDVENRNAVIARQNLDLERRVEARTLELQAMTRAAEAANDAKSRFLANISHELRTPLNAISGACQLITREGGAAVESDNVRMLAASTRMLRTLIDDVLDVSLIESGALTLDPKPFDLNNLVQSLSDIYAPLVQEKGLALTVDLTPGGWTTRLGDSDRVMQIACNLVSNAVKMTERGSVFVRIAAEADNVFIEVTDTGPGIPEAHQSRIFDRFVQVDGSKTRSVGGAGLGLSICRDLVQLMGGTIQVRSRPGRGAAFAVNLPLPPAEAEPAIQPTGAVAETDGLKVLIVDDNAANRQILEAFLGHLGVSCGLASNGQEAVEAWTGDRWDAILMDVHMPVMDGLQATRNIRKLELEQSRPRTPIVAVTASVLNHETARYGEAGMDELVPKPVDMTFLAQVLGEQLERQAQAA